MKIGLKVIKNTDFNQVMMKRIFVLKFRDFVISNSIHLKVSLIKDE